MCGAWGACGRRGGGGGGAWRCVHGQARRRVRTHKKSPLRPLAASQAERASNRSCATGLRVVLHPPIRHSILSSPPHPQPPCFSPSPGFRSQPFLLFAARSQPVITCRQRSISPLSCCWKKLLSWPFARHGTGMCIMGPRCAGSCPTLRPTNTQSSETRRHVHMYPCAYVHIRRGSEQRTRSSPTSITSRLRLACALSQPLQKPRASRSLSLTLGLPPFDCLICHREDIARQIAESLFSRMHERSQT